MRPWLAIVVLLITAESLVLQGYLKLGSDIGDRVVALKWTSFPVRYQVTNRDVPGVTAPTLQAAVARAFATWGAVPDVTIASEFVGISNREPFVDDDVSVIGFRDRPELDRTLGATTFTVDETTGAILEADIFLNSAFSWSVAAAGEPSRFDVDAIMLHEVGHLLGLGHSALGETEMTEGGRRRVLAKRAVMFPIAFPAGNARDREVTADDAAGLYDNYRLASDRRRGSISGRVRMAGKGIYGAHVTAFNPQTGDLVATFTLSEEGDFVIAGLEAGMYVLRAEPLDDADIDSFFEESTTVTVDFKPAYAPRLAAVPVGGASAPVEIAVTAK
jgi:hypothetical protein